MYMGSYATTYEPNSIAIGYAASLPSINNTVSFGQIPPDYTIQIRDVSVDLRDVVKMGERITELEEKITEFEKIVEKQQDLITKLWYAPGMPGYEEIKLNFEEHSKQNNE